MSKNSKNSRKIQAARAISVQRKKGNKGPARTAKKSTKKMTWFALKDGKLTAAAMARAALLEAKRAEAANAE